MTVVKELITKLTFKVNKKGIERYERDVKRMTRELTRLSAEARKPLVVRFNKRSLHDATKSLREAKTEARGLKNAARGNFNIRLNVTGEGAVRSARQQVERLRRSQRSAGASGYVAGRMARGGRGGMGSLAGMALLGGGGYSAYRLASFIGGAGGEEELLQARLGRMLGSKTAAIDTMNRQRNFAAVTPYTTSELTSGYIDIAAQGVKLTNDQQTALGDLAAMSGKSYGELMEAMKSANRGMGSMVDNFVGLKAKAKDGRLEMQMLDNVTGKWVKKMVDAGDMKGIVDFFVKGGKRSNIAGTMSDMSQTMPGKTSTLMDNLKLAASNLWFSGLGEVTHSITDGLLNWVQQDLQPAATEIGGAIKALSGLVANDSVKGLANSISERFGQSKDIAFGKGSYYETMMSGGYDGRITNFSEGTADFLFKNGSMLLDPIAQLLGFGPIKGGTTSGTLDLIKQRAADRKLSTHSRNAGIMQRVGNVTPAQHAINQRVRQNRAEGLAKAPGMQTDMSKHAASMKGFGGIIDNMSARWADFKTQWTAGAHSMGQSAVEMGYGAYDAVAAFASRGKMQISNFGRSASNTFQGWMNSAKGYIQGIWDSVKNMASGMKDSVSNAIESIKSYFSGLSESATSVFNRIKNSASNMFGGAINQLMQMANLINNMPTVKSGGGAGGAVSRTGRGVANAIRNASPRSRGGWLPPGYQRDNYLLRGSSGEFMIRQSTASQIMRNPAQGFQRLAHDMGVQTRPHTAPVVQGGGVQVSYNPVFHINGAANPQATAGSVMQKFERGATMAINKAARASSGLATA